MADAERRSQMTGPTEHFSVLSDLRGAWDTRGSGFRLRAVRKAGEALRERFAKGPQVVSVRSLPITTLPYPTKYAFWSAAYSPVPFVTMTHRALLVQFMQK